MLQCQDFKLKKFYSLIFSLLLISTVINAQTPQTINYQGVARDNSGNVLDKMKGIWLYTAGLFVTKSSVG